MIYDLRIYIYIILINILPVVLNISVLQLSLLQ